MINIITMLGNLLILISIGAVIASNVTPVDNLDLSMYAGRWYQVVKDKFDMAFQGDGRCAVADYGLTETNVTVLNSQVDKDGKVDQIAGYAFYKKGNSGGYLTVKLDGVPTSAPYWVLELGPITNDQYDYSIISDNVNLSLFVITRNVTRYYDIYVDKVNDSLMKYGFTGTLTKPVTISQNDCDYSKY